MQKDLLEHLVAPDLGLEPRDGGGDADAHARGPADEDGRAAAQDAAPVGPARRPLPQHVAQVGPAVLDAPAPARALRPGHLVRHGKREPHQALLELGRRLREPEVEARGGAERRRWSGLWW